MNPHCIIADDELNLAEYLKARLAALWPQLSIDGIARNGPEALVLLDEYQPQIAFLDIKMPGLTGLEVAAQLSHPTHIVFVTAYDQYAVAAFERAAVDYLLKPVTDERLGQCIARLQNRLNSSTAQPDLSGLLAQLLQGTAGKPGYLRWIRAGASSGNNVRQIAVADVLYFDAADKYTRVITAVGESLIRLTIRELTEQLDPQMFTQIHRSTIVNLHCVASTTRSDDGRITLHLKDHTEPLPVSRAYAGLFKQM